MEIKINFKDPYFTGSKTDKSNGLTITYPVADVDTIANVAENVRRNARYFFSSHSFDEIQDKIDTVDRYFCDQGNQEIKQLVNFIHNTSGFSRFDIENYGLGIFPLLADYDRDKRSKYVNTALKTPRVIETIHGYLKRFGIQNPFCKWKEPDLVSHFISGNVVGYTSILSRIGFPVKEKGAGQILKLPSLSAFFPMVYLNKLNDIYPELRGTIACGYWQGGDQEIEKVVIKESDAINILSSDEVINDLLVRIKQYNPKTTTLLHGHKIGIAYIASEFLEIKSLLDQVLYGLVCDISAFDGGACCNVKNIYVQGDVKKFSEELFTRLDHFAKQVSLVSYLARPVGNHLYKIYLGSGEVLMSEEKNAMVRMKHNPEFWKPDALYRYVQVMPVKNEKEVYHIIKGNSRYLQTAIVAVPDEKIIPVLNLFGKAGVSNIHYPGTAPLLHVSEEPHDCDFDFFKVRYNYSVKFAATNFKKNSDWLL
jgi:hypothetical protein